MGQAAGRNFDPNYLIDDIEFVNSEGLSANAINRFLNLQTGRLATYATRDIDGLDRNASDIIWRAATLYQINPKVLIVMMQKEQSLVEDPDPSSEQLDWAMGFAVCDSCSKNDPAIQKFKGFAVQVDRAAARLRYYLDNPEEFSIQPLQPYNIDGQTITPVNQASAGLYIYTPHLPGNENFWNIWNRYFSRYYPDGSLLRNGSNDEVWLISSGMRRGFAYLSTLRADYDMRKIIDVAPADLEQYDIGSSIKFPAYSLLRSPGGTVYLLVNNTRRGIPSREDFRRLGFNPDEIIDVSWNELAAIPEAAALTASAGAPVGELLQNQKSGAVYYLLAGKVHPIRSRELLKSNFPDWPIKPMTADKITQLPEAEPIGFKDGELIVSETNPTVYVISNGLRRPFDSADTFEELGYQWSNIIRTTDGILLIHRLGQQIST